MTAEIQREIAQVNNLIPGSFADVVALYDSNFNQILSNARPLKASIKRDVKEMVHPLESGEQVIDHRIINAVEIEFGMILPSSNAHETYQQILQYFLNSVEIIVQTRADTYPNQFMISMPHEENTDYYDSYYLVLKTKQILYATSTIVTTPKNPNNRNTVSKGTVQTETPSSANTVKASTAYKLVYQ